MATTTEEPLFIFIPATESYYSVPSVYQIIRCVYGEKRNPCIRLAFGLIRRKKKKKSVQKASIIHDYYLCTRDKTSVFILGRRNVRMQAEVAGEGEEEEEAAEVYATPTYPLHTHLLKVCKHKIWNFIETRRHIYRLPLALSFGVGVSFACASSVCR